jgi:chloramphenicol 3-O-phosphotransferase
MSVILLSGPVAAGKTTVARELIGLIDAPLCYIEGDAFWSFFKKDSHSRREQFRVMMRSMTAAAVPLSRAGARVIVDFSIPPDFLPTARKIVKELPLHYVLLLPSLGVCEARAAARKEGQILDYDAYRDFYALFAAPGPNAICDDEADAGTLASRIRDGLDSDSFRVQ